MPGKRLVVVVLLSFLSDCCLAQIPIEDQLYGSVLGIEGKTHEERGMFIEYQLRKMGVGYFTAPFETMNVRGSDTTKIAGQNIIVKIGRGKKKIVVGAHYDAVPGSPGANDNGGGVAVVLGLIKTMKDIRWNCSVDFCFFDREEDGLIGSEFYIRQFADRNNHLAMINLDVEGTGEEIFAGPVGGGDDDILMPLLRQAAQKTKFRFNENAIFPDSDQESFAKEKLENICISIVPKGDADLLVAMVKNGWRAEPGKLPKVMRVMHSPMDGATEMTPEALRMSYEFTKTVLLLLNDTTK